MIEKFRVHEIAKELDIASKDVIKKALEIGIEVKSAQSAVTMEEADSLMNYIMHGDNITSAVTSGKKEAVKVKSDQTEVIIDTSSKKKASESNFTQSKHINFNTIFTETGLTKKEIITFAKNLGVTITKKTKLIEQSIYKKIIDYALISIYEIAKVHGLTPETIIDYATKVGISVNDSQTKIKANESKKITNYIFEQYEQSRKNKHTNIENKIKLSSDSINYTFDYKNILLKGVPGTGKSRTIDKIIENKLNIKSEKNVLRINIHSSSSNADLMQGIGINSNDGNIEYREKQGLILDFIQKATFNPHQPFALILEEVQENSLNELIGDLIYLIEDNKRTKNITADDKFYTYDELVQNIIDKNDKTSIVEIPNLVDYKKSCKKMLLPNNLYMFCTSNYRDDKKVIEDNLLRRFDVIEIYPKYKSELENNFKNQDVSNFLEELNKSIIKVCSDNGEIHPDRFMIGHSIWLDVYDKKSFNRAFLKVTTEFKDIKDFHFEDFNQITENINFPFNIENNYENYSDWIKDLQKNCYDFLD